MNSFLKKEQTFIIAEIGQNHQGDIDVAKKMIQIAKDCGADCVKFQKTDIAEKFTKAALEQPYKSIHSWGETYGEHKAFLEFSDEQYLDLQKCAQEVGILFTASAMDANSLKFLISMKVPFIKIGSGDSNNFLLIREAAKTNVPLIISTGMIDFDTVKQIHKLVANEHKNFALLHCTSSYPTPYDQINLNILKLYQNAFPDIVIGYSGHELGFHVSLAAVALGAKVVERHFTLDKTQKGSDHRCSLEPVEFKQMVLQIRDVERSLGTMEKVVRPCERICYEKLGKSLVYSKNLQFGHKLELDDIKIKVAKPFGTDALRINEAIGKCLNKNVFQDESIYCTDFQNYS